MRNLLLIILAFSIHEIMPQSVSDSVKTNRDSEFKKLQSLNSDWQIINSPFRFSSTDFLFFPTDNSRPLYELYADAQLNSGVGFGLQPHELLSQFKLANNWETQKRYGVFAKYLGIAEFMGAVGLAAIHISKFHKPPKGKTDLGKNKFFDPKKEKDFKLHQLTE